MFSYNKPFNISQVSCVIKDSVLGQVVQFHAPLYSHAVCEPELQREKEYSECEHPLTPPTNNIHFVSAPYAGLVPRYSKNSGSSAYPGDYSISNSTWQVPCIHGFTAHSSISTSQLLPVYPSKHSQKYPSTWSCRKCTCTGQDFKSKVYIYEISFKMLMCIWLM